MNTVPATVEEYIESFSPNIQAVLRAVRATVRHAAPQAEERISYRMPALFHNGAVVYFGAFKNHLGLFPPVEDPALLAKVAQYAGPKGQSAVPVQPASAPRTHCRRCPSQSQVQCNQGCSKAHPAQECVRQASCS